MQGRWNRPCRRVHGLRGLCDVLVRADDRHGAKKPERAVERGEGEEEERERGEGTGKNVDVHDGNSEVIRPFPT